MREIKFRGRDTNGDWHYGDLLRYVRDSYDMIIPAGHANSDDLYDDVVCVDYDTVGQFTGIKDISGAEIYEGDIITFKDCETDEYVPGAVGQSVEGTWWVECAEFRVPLWNVCKTALILSNIYDSPELLEADYERD